MRSAIFFFFFFTCNWHDTASSPKVLWQAVWFFGEEPKPDLETLPIKSPLLNNAFRYYTTNVEAASQVDLTAAEVLAEVMRIHEAAKAAVVGKNMEDPHPHWQTWGNLVQYQVFHVAYHTGQVYSVRHLLGHETEDN